MARDLLLCVLLALAAGVAWVVLRSDAAASSAGGAATAAVAAASAAQASAAPAAEPEAATSRVAVTPEPAAGSAPAIPAAAKWLDVLVVDKSTGEPVPGAEVAWSDGTTFLRLPVAEQTVWLGRDPERIARDYGWKTASDEHGKARVHQGDPFSQVFARKDGRFGQANASKSAPPPPPLRIELAEDRTLLAKVLDAAGNPAPGVPVAIALHGADGTFLRFLGSPVTQSKAPDGLARVAHLQELHDRSWGNQVQVPAAEWRVRLHLPGVTDPGIAFDPNAPPAEPIVLRLPATCSVAVHVELAGRIVPIGGNIDLAIARPPGSNTESPNQQLPVDSEGIARFPYVPLEGTLLLSVYLMPTQVKKELPGPRSAGQRVDVVLEVPPEFVVLTGRVLGEDRQPLRKSSVVVDFHSDSSSGGAMMPTDRDGRFLFFLGPAREKPSLDRFVASLTYQDRTPLRAALSARELRPGVQDVGDLVLEPGPLVVAGRFLAGTQPYEGNVGFVVERAEPPRGRGEQVAWEQVPGLTTRQSRGAFEARGEVAPGRYRIVFPAYDHLPVAPLEFALGTKDLVVQVERGVPVTGKLEMPPAMPAGVLAVLRPNDPSAAPRRDDDTPMVYRSSRDRHVAEPWEQSPGHYVLRWQPLPPGNYTLELRLWGQPDLLLSVPDVAVPLRDGDKRLAELDLRGKVETLTLRVLGVEPKPGGRGGVLVFPMPQDAAAEDWLAYGLPAGTSRLPVPLRAVDLLVATEEGLRPAEVRAARGEAEARLEPWPRTELVFEGLDAALPAGTRLVARAEAAAKPTRGRYVTRGGSGGRDSLLEPRQENATIDGGRARLALGPGPQRLAVYLAREGGRWRRLEGVTPAEVRTGAEPVAVRVPPEALRDAIAELQAASEGKK